MKTDAGLRWRIGRREVVLRLADAKGWTCGRVRAEGCCYTTRARDSDGHGLKARIDPEPLAVLGVAHESERDDDDGCGPQAAPARTVAPPDNGLFQKGGAGVVVK